MDKRFIVSKSSLEEIGQEDMRYYLIEISFVLQHGNYSPVSTSATSEPRDGRSQLPEVWL